jgi:hypothetical protein
MLNAWPSSQEFRQTVQIRKRGVRFDTSQLRRTSDSADSFPWRARDVTVIHVAASSGLVTQAQGITEKRAVLDAAAEEDLLLVAWPGQWRQDVFVIDDRETARQGLDPPGKPT